MFDGFLMGCLSRWLPISVRCVLAYVGFAVMRKYIERVCTQHKPPHIDRRLANERVRARDFGYDDAPTERQRTNQLCKSMCACVGCGMRERFNYGASSGCGCDVFLCVYIGKYVMSFCV